LLCFTSGDYPDCSICDRVRLGGSRTSTDCDLNSSVSWPVRMKLRTSVDRGPTGLTLCRDIAPFLLLRWTRHGARTLFILFRVDTTWSKNSSYCPIWTPHGAKNPAHAVQCGHQLEQKSCLYCSVWTPHGARSLFILFRVDTTWSKNSSYCPMWTPHGAKNPAHAVQCGHQLEQKSCLYCSVWTPYGGSNPVPAVLCGHHIE
jgi:hypothetical protein